MEPVGLKDAAAAGLESLRLAWSADPLGLIVAALVQGVTASAEVAHIFSTASAVDAVVAADRPRSQTGRLVALGGLGLVSLIGRRAGSAFEAPLGQAVSRRAEARVLDVVAAVELADVEDPRFQDRVQRALTGARRQPSLLSGTLSIPPAVIALVGALAAMRRSDRALVPLGLAGAVPQWMVMRRSQDPVIALGGRVPERREAGILRHYLTGAAAAPELRVFGATGFLRARHDALADQTTRAEIAVNRDNARRVVLGSLAARAADAPAAVRLVLRVARNEASLADALAGGLATRRTSGGFHGVIQAIAGVRRTAAVVDGYRTFAPELPGPRTRPLPPPSFRRIRVEGLTFTYPGADRPVLRGVDLEIGQGEVVALVGENGCGKTTLAKLLCCLYEPTGGRIWWDDVDVGACDPAGVRARIGIVFQDFYRYPSLTAAENIGIGMPERMGDAAAIVEAARRAGAHDAIAALPRGYGTVLSRAFGGTDLSTGQWQRLALARAFLRDAPLVVLDEPTAALDPRAERDLFETVASLYASRSALLISHRLSSVRFASRICVLAEGRIIETGTHDELLAAGGAYAELFELQARAYR